MLDHVSMRVADYDRSKNFYIAALAPLGYKLAMEGDSGAGFSKASIPDFWVKKGEPGSAVAPTESRQDLAEVGTCGGPRVHIAFASDDRRTVDAFYRAAIDAGARDNGAPALRPKYHPNYYGAFVIDPDGYNIEAVCHKAE
jgi:catechol 2,3-dioxygenase-like lactoylglutathione lyase family enzyme